MKIDFSVFANANLAEFMSVRLPRSSDALVDVIKQQRLWRNGELVEDAQLQLQAGDCLELALPGHQELAVNCQWQLIWQNDEFMVVNKPAGLPVSRTTRNLFHTLISLVRRQTPYFDAHLMHRLDAETRGLMLLAKNSHVDKKWKKKADRLLAEKEYQAWVWGTPDWQQYDMQCDISERLDSAIRSQMYVCDEQAELYKKPQYSRTVFTLLRSEGNRSLIRCRLYTGRKHQIRCHLAHLGHPIIGDKVYSFDGHFYLKRLQQELLDEDYRELGAEFQQLQAVRLGLHLYGQSVNVPLPSRFGIG